VRFLPATASRRPARRLGDAGARGRAGAAGPQRRRARAQLQALYDASPAGIVATDLEHRITRCNRAFAAMVGLTPPEAVGRHCWEFLHPDSAPPDLVAVADLVAGLRDSHTAERVLRRGDGSPLPVRIDASVVRAGRRRVALAFVVTDISARAGAQAAQEALERALGDVAAARAELARRQAFTETLLETIDVGIVSCDAAGGGLVRNRAERELLGLPSQAAGAPAEATAPPSEVYDSAGVPLDPARYPLLRALRGEVVADTEFRLGPAGGPMRDVVMRGTRLTGADGEVVGALATMTDVTAERNARRLFEAILTASPDYTFVTDIRTGAVVYGPPGGLLLGTSSEKLCALGSGAVARLVHPDDQAQLRAANARARDLADGEVLALRHRLRHADGSWHWLDRRVTPFRRDARTGEVVEVLGVIRDVTEIVEAEERLAHSALHDPLTGLPNRALLMDRMDAAVARACRTERQIAVLFCDLDGFKKVNDAGGHAAGDAVLVESARRMRRVLRENDTLARVGGDEFVVLVEPWRRPGSTTARPDGEALALHLAERLVRALRTPVRLGDAEHLVTASIGICFAGQGTGIRTADAALQAADAAMYRAKRAGKDSVAVV
jgi:diguanylate cyclase (GGDEF)-like protein/PAS domain S-box-containing protein